MATAIEFNNVSKQYRLGLVSTKTLSHDLNRWWQTAVLKKEDPYLKIGSTNDRSAKADSEYVWALKDIDFKVEQGDVVGIIGKNGAGKSTLLKLLSRVTGPTTGSINVKGRIGALLEVGTGFHPEMTGRENIYMNGAILGMTKPEITRKLDEIIDFSGCERYIDTPVKRYSSGMTVRLGFAVAAHLDPEILVVDEVLAVGDAEFQKKAIGKMQDVSKGEGRTVLFVSHNMASMRALCRHGVLLEDGLLKAEGDMENIIDLYDSSNEITNLQNCIKNTDDFRVEGFSRKLEYLEIHMMNDVQHMSSEEPLHFKMIIKRNDMSINHCQFGIVINSERNEVAGVHYSHEVFLPENIDKMTIDLILPNHNLSKGKYKLNFNISNNDFVSNIENYDLLRNGIAFEVVYIDAGHKNPYGDWYFSGKVLYPKSEIKIFK